MSAQPVYNVENLEPGHQPGVTLKPLVKLPKDPAACWPYLGSVDSRTGYGKKQWHGRTYLAHRWLWMQLFGPIPDHLSLVDTCGNRACINPHHWVLGTMKARAEHSVHTVLTAGDVVEIKKIPKKDRATRAQRSMLAGQFAARFGCSKQLVYDIWGGRAWAGKKPSRATLPHPEAASNEQPESNAAG